MIINSLFKGKLSAAIAVLAMLTSCSEGQKEGTEPEIPGPSARLKLYLESFTTYEATSYTAVPVLRSNTNAGVIVDGVNYEAAYKDSAGIYFITEPIPGMSTGKEFRYYYPFNEDAYISDGSDGNPEGSLVFPFDGIPVLHQSVSREIDASMFPMSGKTTSKAVAGNDLSEAVDIELDCTYPAVWTVNIATDDQDIKQESVKSVKVTLGTFPVFGGAVVFEEGTGPVFKATEKECSTILDKPQPVTSAYYGLDDEKQGTTPVLYITSLALGKNETFTGGYFFTVTTDKHVYQVKSIEETKDYECELEAGAITYTRDNFPSYELMFLTKDMRME